jgi:hypothetical protein
VGSALGCGLEGGNVELLHLHEGRRDALTGAVVAPSHDLFKDGGNDLPGDAEAILQPAALARLAAASDQAVPVVVDFCLGIAMDLEGDGLGLGGTSGRRLSP